MEQSEVYRNLSREEFEDISSRILFEDNHFLIFNKRSGEIVQGDRTGDEPLSETLKAFIAQRDNKAGQVFMGVAHRLDRPVSGAVLFAKTSKGLERINEMLRQGEVHKTYWALVQTPLDGVPDSVADPDGWVELHHFMYRDEKNNKSYIYRGKGAAPHGYKEARLLYRILKVFDHYTLLEVVLLTGRHHQIRCQLSSIGCPIKGDLKYGSRRSNRDGSICLHARYLEFIHPIGRKDAHGEATGNDKLICVEAPLSGELARISGSI
ncbi:MAG: RluA family pseudouridine synthase [Bacteroidales bacterium]|nr:RluA family pseudouridine synthase [Bacteroidales bacterium]MBQ1886028.1 RluA family pseudouridine synthase [Bacteroidales bacterium]